MQQNFLMRSMMTLASDSTEDRPKQDKREPHRDSSASPAPSKPIRAPFLSDGPELIRDSHC
jgi:hypothetical protein